LNGALKGLGRRCDLTLGKERGACRRVILEEIRIDRNRLPEGLAHLSKVHLGELRPAYRGLHARGIEMAACETEKHIIGNRHRGLLRKVEALLKLSLSQLR